MAIARRSKAAGLLSVDGDNDNNAVATRRGAAGTGLVNDGAVAVESRTPTVVNINVIQKFGLGGSDTLSLNEINEAMLVTAPFAGEQRAAVVTLSADNDAVETVALLLHWCPHQARAFALAMHELAAWQYDDGRTEHWHHVLGLLPRSYTKSQ